MMIKSNLSVRLKGWLFVVAAWLICAGDFAWAEYPGKEWHTAASMMQKGWDVDRLARLNEQFEYAPTSAFILVEGGTVINSFGKVKITYPINEMSLIALSALYGHYALNDNLPMSRSLKRLEVEETPPLTRKEAAVSLRDLFQSRVDITRPAAFDDQPYKPKIDPRYSDLVWRYNQWGFNALASIYEHLSQERFLTSFESNIAIPIEMDDFRGVRHGYELFSVTSKHMAPLFEMSARDLARLGLLFLEQGRWKKQQLLSKEWVAESTRIKSTSAYSIIDGNKAGGFGFLWWVEQNQQLFPGVIMPQGSYALQGRGGQYLVVIPSMQLVIVHLNDTSFHKKTMTPEMFGQVLNEVLLAKQPLTPLQRDYGNPQSD